ncbi:MAG: FAD-dependent thymidylate synthase [Clostridium argentinense]|uniref:Flavin-dependent thymidylate synthase n=1 Tax=Clostridium faecium TaxID=2762223 RepID=A0ABR8YNN4_9CLOT|nr:MULTISPECIES: FAD-dependent thymidylate synthase [Clostridium]MBD8045656.1 FAD-dependent thymidylate synthase [Clostridium faecium]MBS5824525.1 FAD-dependent thymidylate synthase [Clostridium argentinense]MDU1351036.1 FAD-dependent thymidylate synthase [Clostridium argentinense]
MTLKVKLIEHTPNPEKVIASAAKLCYSSVGVDEILEGLDKEKTEKFLSMLVNYGHYSPIEHVSFTFAIEGVSRSLTHQLVRHRVASYSQQSQRYVKLDAFEYITPPAIESNSKAKEIFVEAMKKDQEYYDRIVEILFEQIYNESLNKYIEEKSLDSISEVEEKVLKRLKSQAQKRAIEDARYVFPNACETKIIVTMNARELMHFFGHRCCKRAQWEIRDMADAMLKEAKKVAPILFKKSGPNCVSGPCPEGAMTCGEIVTIREKYSNL